MRTSRSKADNINNFNNLCEKDRELLSGYRDMIIRENYPRIATRKSVINTLAEFLTCVTDCSIYDLDASQCEAFLNGSGWSKDYQQLALKTLKEIFILANIKLDLSGIDLREGSIESTDYILNYSHLIELVRESGKNYIVKKGTQYFFTKDATTVTTIFLAWLGIPISDAVKLKDSDINFATKTISAAGKCYSFLGCAEIEKHFLTYISTDMYVFAKGSETFQRRYLDTELFIKQTKPGLIYKETIAGKIKKFCGQTYESFLISGRLNRLYNYEQSGGIISSDNYKVISEITGIPINKRNTALENILDKYKTYKEKRNHYTLKR